MKTRVSAKVKLMEKMKMRPIFIVGAGIVLSGLTVAAIFIILNLGNSENTFAAGSTYSSGTTGNWTTNSTWSGGTAPPTTSINGDNITVNSSNFVTSGALDVLNNATFTISSNGTLKIVGDLTVQNNLVLNVSGLLIITGNLVTKNGGNITINGGGTTKIAGSATFDNNTVLTVNGALQVGTTISFGSSPTFRGSGVVKVGSSGCSAWAGPGSCGVGTLPVKLLSFVAEEVGGVVKVTWKTVMEENNDFFTLQRTADGKTYTTIGIIRGAGTSKNTLAYEYEDKFPLEGRSYYRLSQTDYDGKSETFPHVTVDILYGVTQRPSSFTIFPNPLVGNILSVSISKPAEGTIEILDSRGNSVLSHKVDARETEIQLTLNENVPPGVYLVSYKSNSIHKTERLVKR